MISPSRILIGLLIGAFTCTGALADTVAVKFTGRVVDVWDPASILNGQPALGQQVTGTYTYDTSPTDQDPSWNAGQYSEGMGMTSVSVSAGPVTFQSWPLPGGSSTLDVLQSAWVGHWPGEFQIYYYGNQPLTNGASVDTIHFDFLDSDGLIPATPAIPTDLPDLQNYEGHTIDIWGSLGSNSYQVRIQIDTVARDNEPAFEISPAAGHFIAQQRFDAALLIPPGKAVAHVLARANGNPLPLEYPGACVLAPPNPQGRTAVICPNAHTQLAQLPPSTPIEWDVQLIDGTLLTATVLWELIQ